MADQKSFGYATSVRMKREATYGVDPAGNYVDMAFDNCGLIGRKSQSKSALAGAGRDPKEMFQGPLEVSGPVTVPMDMRYIGHWLTGLLGNPTTAGSAPYVHTFTSGKTALPSYAIEVGHSRVPKYLKYLGCMVNSMMLDFPRSGPMQGRFDLIGQSRAAATSTGAGTPSTLTFARASGFHGTIKYNGSSIGHLNSANFTYNNNLAPQETLNQAGGQIQGIDPGEASLTGALSMNFYDDTFLDVAAAGTPVDLEFGVTISASLKLIMKVHEAYLEMSDPPIDGPAGVDINFNFEALYNTSGGEMFEAVLSNDQAGTVYTS